MNDRPPASIALEKLNVPHRIFKHDTPVTSFEQAAADRNQRPGQIVRSILFNIRPDEFLMVVPMGEDNELIAANTAEQIAKRLTFRPEAINQIKTAIVEACINASEHSFSPDRKIYQRFRVESDRLVITISSRGIVPANLNGTKSGSEAKEAAEERRGWGLKLIRTLMDEVEFERVDDGTSLRMTKYLRTGSS